MNCTSIWKNSGLLLLATTLVLGGSFCQAAQNNRKATAAPARPAARPAPQTARPTGNPGGGALNRPTGSSAIHPAGPAANRPMANAPLANRSAGFTANRPMANNPNVNRPSYNPAVNRVGFSGARSTPRGSQVISRPNGNSFVRRANGQVGDVHDASRGLDIHHGLDGRTRVSVMRADHSRIVAERGRPGFIERPFGRSFRGHDFARRSFYYHGRAYDRFYRSYMFHGAAIEVYAPFHYFGVGFYGWAYNPWFHPVVYAWGWGPSPWYGYYGPYFAPYPAYPSASAWLTDYMISSDLQADYQANQDTGTMPPPPPSDGSAVLSPEVKQMISNEVATQIALENSEAQQNAAGQDPDPGSSGIARLLSDGHAHVFVAGSDLDVVDASGNECALSGGDALELTTDPAPADSAANLTVLASKGGQECPKSDTVTVALTDLQEMQNHMRATIDDGLAKLQAEQGQGGLPPAPPSAQVPPVNAGFASIAPPAEPSDSAQEVNQQQAQAAAMESSVTAQSQ